MDIANDYSLVIAAVGLMALLLLLQVVVADVVGIKKGHKPGMPIEANHNSGLFRAVRTVTNTNESIAVFILAVMFCLFSGASAHYAGVAAMGFVVARALYAICYYFNLQIARSIVFGVSLMFLAALIAIGFLT